MKHFKFLVILLISLSLVLGGWCSNFLGELGGGSGLVVVKVGRLVYFDFISSLKFVIDIACLVGRYVGGGGGDSCRDVGGVGKREVGFIFFVILNLGFINLIISQVFIVFCFVRFLSGRYRFYLMILILIIPILVMRFSYYMPRSSIDSVILVLDG